MVPSWSTTHVGNPRAHEHHLTPSELGDTCLASGRHAGFWGPGGKNIQLFQGSQDEDWVIFMENHEKYSFFGNALRVFVFFMSLNSSHGVVSMIFGLLGKFGIDTGKTYKTKNTFGDQKIGRKIKFQKNIFQKFSKSRKKSKIFDFRKK